MNPYPAVVSFDKYIADVRHNTVGYDQYQQRYEINIELFDIDESFLFDSDNDRMMRLLVPQQFQVRINNAYYDVDSVEYEPVGHVILKAYAPVGNVSSVAVHINLRYFDNQRQAWQVPDCVKKSFADDDDDA
ncbi:hypothetical protein [Alphabaculovirus myunipunctae]|uniref:Uncharacterized protein n=1 Tax=Mythimna unipuncta nucleopolyhedrovirus TaxID=447897 RepID=A0A2K9VS78_9ABAC|nr:hypothetical protein [Mythimna unipuncta nucleopolyhedrovirus]AUV65315.1 hypothetical protein [Mythimna unipuncta nucleopolyhedrovirus]